MSRIALRRKASSTIPRSRVWSGSSLERYPTIAARWEPRRIQGLKLVVSEAHEPQRPTSQVAIEEIVLPGYDVQVR